MKKAYIKLIVLAIVLVLLSFCLLWFNTGLFLTAIPLAVLYFSVVTGLMYFAIVKSAMKDPRIFIRDFLGLTVGAIFLHLIVLAAYMFTHLQQAKIFAVAFCILFAIYLTFLTVELVVFVKHQK